MCSYFVDAARVKMRYEHDKERYDKFAENVIKSLNADESDILACQYQIYNVDNEFDLVEAMWKADRCSTGDLLSEPWFNKLRLKCVMNPEYTERCFASPAFADIKRSILR